MKRLDLSLPRRLSRAEVRLQVFRGSCPLAFKGYGANKSENQKEDMDNLGGGNTNDLGS